ncbi:MAG: DNA polymerase III subunit gamma/tau [Vulcanimicrobiaceae bacterium]
MSLYRTWRPRSFSELVGQAAVVRTLETALRTGKLAHAYLFSGPRGSGKTSAAKILARCINCRLGPTPEPDNTCDFCQTMLAGTALDVLEIDAASNRGIEEIRAIRDAVKFAPAQMRSKVYIIDEAHMLTREGANAFLKTLEEPPPHVVFVLATTAPEALPPTILSRCQRYAFRRIPVPTMIEQMRTIARGEQIAIDDSGLSAIAYRADGGLRDALTMLEQVAAFTGAHAGSGATIDAGAVDAAFGTTGHEYARQLVAAMLDGDAAGALRAVDSASDAGAEMLGLIRATIGEFRHLLVARIDPNLLDRDLSDDDARTVHERAETTPQVKLVRALRLFGDALGASRSSGNPRLELETAALRLVLQGEDPTLDALATRVTLLEADSPAISAAPPAVPAAKAAAPAPAVAKHEPPVEAVVAHEAAAAAPPTLQRVRSLWRSVRTRVEEAAMPLRGPLTQATVDSVDGATVTLGHHDEIQAALLRDRAKLIEGALSEVAGTPMRVAIRVGAGRGDARSRPAERTGAAPVPTAGEHDLLAYAMQQFEPAEDR